MLPELALTGYPPIDLLERDGFVRDQLRELDALAAASQRVAIALGAVLPTERREGKQLANAAVLLAGGKRVARAGEDAAPDLRRVRREALLRARGGAPARGARRAVRRSASRVCEDGWVGPRRLQHRSDRRARAGGRRSSSRTSPRRLGTSASLPSGAGLFCDLAAKRGVPIAFCNQVGGNDELIFDGGSFVVDARGRVLASLPLFEPAFAVVDLDERECARTGCRRRARARRAARSRARARHPRLLPQAGPAARRGDRPLGRRRLRGDRAPRRRGARARQRAPAWRCPARSPRTTASRTPTRWRSNLGIDDAHGRHQARSTRAIAACSRSCSARRTITGSRSRTSSRASAARR